MTQDEHLQSVHPDLRRKARAILTRMRDLGYDPWIFQSLRSPDQQRRLVASGRSWTMRSRHLRQRDGFAHALDIADRRVNWAASKDFWLTLGRLALLHGLDWGGFYYLSRGEKSRLRRFLTYPYPEGEWEREARYQWTDRLGRDPAHIELPASYRRRRLLAGM